MDCLANAAACFVIWEIWLARNANRHDHRPKDSWIEILSWIRMSTKSISAPYHKTFQTNSTIASLHLEIPRNHRPTPRWTAWYPPNRDHCLDIAFLTRDNTSYMSALIRDKNGQLSVAWNFSFSTSRPLDNLNSCIEDIKSIIWDKGITIARVQSSHPSFWFLSSPEEEVPQDSLYVRRAIHTSFPDAHFHRIAPYINSAAIAMVCTAPTGLFHSIQDLPIHARRAISADSLSLQSCNVLQFPNHTQDDGSMPRGPRYTVFQHADDNSI